MGYSDTFRRAFAEAYAECHDIFANEAGRQDYHVDWNRFMLWRPEPPLEKPVLQLTAEKMGLKYWDREPFRFDGAFVAKPYRVVGKDYPIPIIAVFEHESKIAGFEKDVVKLAQIRCPLKIGITYTEAEAQGSAEGKISEWVREIRRELNELTEEDHKCEYVYLLGVDKQPYMVDWYHLTFDAASEPANFQVLPKPGAN
jgi:hypothetical protein